MQKYEKVNRLQNKKGTFKIPIPNITKIIFTLAFSHFKELTFLTLLNKPFFITFVPMNTKQKSAKPFVKWAGGKTQLIKDINLQISPNTYTYIEPFVGS